MEGLESRHVAGRGGRKTPRPFCAAEAEEDEAVYKEQVFIPAQLGRLRSVNSRCQ